MSERPTLFRLERDGVGDLRLSHEIGAGWTKRLAMTGRRIDAQTALRIGIEIGRASCRERV